MEFLRPAPLHAAFKNLLRQITFGRIWNNRHNALPRSQLLRNLQRGENSRAATRSRQYTFLSRERFDHIERIFVHHHYDFVADRPVKGLGNEAGSNSFYFVRTRLSPAINRSLCLYEHS